MIKAVFFDLDGTILDTLDDLADSLNHVLKQNGLKQRTLVEVKSFVGNGIYILIQKALASDDDKLIQKVYEQFNDYYIQHCMDKTRSFAGIKGLISTLKDKGIKTAVISNKNHNAVDIIIQKYFPNDFDVIVGLQKGLNKKPACDMVDYATKQLQINNKEVLYIGDSEVDYQMAINSKIRYLLVSYGFRDREKLPAGALIVDDVETLKENILNIIDNRV